MASSMDPLMRIASCRLSLPRTPRRTSRRWSRRLSDLEDEPQYEDVPSTRHSRAISVRSQVGTRTSFIQFSDHDRTAFMSIPNSWRYLYKPLPNPGNDDQIGPREQTIKELKLESKEDPDGRSGRKGLRGWSLAAVTVAVLLASFTTQLDESIIATPLPSIASQFHSLGDVGWYGSAYYLPQAVLHPLLGQIYVRWKIKQVYLIALIIFEGRI